MPHNKNSGNYPRGVTGGGDKPPLVGSFRQISFSF